jgi:hypothetical protein
LQQAIRLLPLSPLFALTDSLYGRSGLDEGADVEQFLLTLAKVNLAPEFLFLLVVAVELVVVLVGLAQHGVATNLLLEAQQAAVRTALSPAWLLLFLGHLGRWLGLLPLLLTQQRPKPTETLGADELVVIEVPEVFAHKVFLLEDASAVLDVSQLRNQLSDFVALFVGVLVDA